VESVEQISQSFCMDCSFSSALSVYFLYFRWQQKELLRSMSTIFPLRKADLLASRAVRTALSGSLNICQSDRANRPHDACHHRVRYPTRRVVSLLESRAVLTGLSGSLRQGTGIQTMGRSDRPDRPTTHVITEYPTPHWAADLPTLRPARKALFGSLNSLPIR